MARTAGGGIASALAALFLFAGTLTAFALAIDVPAAIDAGRPHPQVKRDLVEAFTQMNLISESSGTPDRRPNAGTSSGASDQRRAQAQSSRHARQDGSRQPGITPGIDSAAAALQNQFQGFDRELARAIVDATRNATRGGMPVRQVVEIKAAVSATIAMRDALKALEDARNSLAALERARQPAQATAANAEASAAGAAEPIEIPDFSQSLKQYTEDLSLQADDDTDSVAAPLWFFGVVVSGLFYLLGVALLVIARRSHGAPHLLRGIAAVACIIVAMGVLHASVSQSQFWEVTAGASMQAMSKRAMSVLQSGPTILAGVTILGAIVMMGWPPRKQSVDKAALTAAGEIGH